MIIEITCPNCNFSKQVRKEKIPVGVRWATCPSCKQRFELYLPPSAVDLEQKQRKTGHERRFERKTSREASPWENRSALGLWRSIYRTCKAVLFSPEKFFSTLTFKGGMGDPLAFGILLGSIGTMFGLFWQFLVMSGGILSSGLGLIGQFTGSLIFLGILVISPLFVLIGMFLTSGICHLLLLMARGGKNGFEATFRVVSYTMASQILGLIPFIGGLAGLIWLLVVQVIGLKEIHETSYLRVLIAFLIPLAIVLVLFITAQVPSFVFR